MIPRLPEAASPLVVEVTIGTKLRPYLEAWYQARKQPGDTPSTFIVRVLKEQAIKDYLPTYVQAEVSAIESAKMASVEALSADVAALGSEAE